MRLVTVFKIQNCGTGPYLSPAPYWWNQHSLPRHKSQTAVLKASQGPASPFSEPPSGKEVSGAPGGPPSRHGRPVSLNPQAWLPHRQRPLMSQNPQAWLPHRQRPVMSLNPQAWLPHRQHSVDGTWAITRRQNPVNKRLRKNIFMCKPRGSGRRDRWLLVWETSKAFGARWSKINCRESFALGTGSPQRVLGSVGSPSLQKWCLRTASSLKQNNGLFFHTRMGLPSLFWKHFLFETKLCPFLKIRRACFCSKPKERECRHHWKRFPL